MNNPNRKTGLRPNAGEVGKLEGNKRGGGVGEEQEILFRGVGKNPFLSLSAGPFFFHLDAGGGGLGDPTFSIFLPFFILFPQNQRSLSPPQFPPFGKIKSLHFSVSFTRFPESQTGQQTRTH